MGCKNYYKLFNESCVIEPTGVKKWKEKFPNDFVDWSNKFLHIYRSSKDNNLRQVSLKLLQGTIVTKKELNKFRLVNDAACTFCSNPDSIEHTFLDCNVVTSCYSESFSWFNQTYDTNIYLSNKQITPRRHNPCNAIVRSHKTQFTFIRFIFEALHLHLQKF